MFVSNIYVHAVMAYTFISLTLYKYRYVRTYIRLWAKKAKEKKSIYIHKEWMVKIDKVNETKIYKLCDKL